MRAALALSLSFVLLSSCASLDRGTAARPEPATTGKAGMPAPPAWLDGLDALYDARIRAPGLDDRRFSPERWWAVAGALASASSLRRWGCGPAPPGVPERSCGGRSP